MSNRPIINFTPPDVYKYKPLDSAELEQHQKKLADLISYDLNGYSWRDAYFLAFGYKGMQPFCDYIQFAPNAVSSLTGKTVVNENDYLDVIYAIIELEQKESELLENIEADRGRGRPRLSIEEQMRRAAIRSAEQDKRDALKRAREKRKQDLELLWQDYQKALLAKKEAEEYHRKVCNDLYKTYSELKSIPIDPDDFI